MLCNDIVVVCSVIVTVVRGVWWVIDVERWVPVCVCVCVLHFEKCGLSRSVESNIVHNCELCRLRCNCLPLLNTNNWIASLALTLWCFRGLSISYG